MTALATVTPLHAIDGAADWDAWRAAWFRRLRVARKAPNTLVNYGRGLDAFRASLEAHGRSCDPAGITLADCEAFMLDLQDRRAAPATQANRYVVAKAFMRFLVREGLRADNPWDRLDKPKVPKVRVPTAPQATIDGLLRVTEGRTFLDLRDRAMVLLMLDAGLRRSEVAGLHLEDLRLDSPLGPHVIVRYSKGEKEGPAPMGEATATALDRYLLHPAGRRSHKYADLTTSRGREDWGSDGHPMFLPDPKGTPNRPRLAADGHTIVGIDANVVGRVLARRSAQAGVAPIHPHQLRHTWAAIQKAGGTTTEDLMVLGRWSDPGMVARYGAAHAESNALAHYRSPVDSGLGRVLGKGQGRVR